ncbi:MAG: hypothetical protein HY986_16910 [Candidatus Melainabacteria bacterium]|nr:hypothetical protein [Candidatus Melainabacteria bacterium]
MDVSSVRKLDDDTLSLPEAVTYFGISRRTLLRRLQRGAMQGYIIPAPSSGTGLTKDEWRVRRSQPDLQLPDVSARDWTLAEASSALGLPLSILSRRLRAGTIRGYRVNGTWGPEWRVVKVKVAPKSVRVHVLSWDEWRKRFPSMASISSQEVRRVALASSGSFPLAVGQSEQVGSFELFCLRGKLRRLALLKRKLLNLHRILISKTYGWLLTTDGAVRARFKPGPDIDADIASILETLESFERNAVNIDRALLVYQRSLERCVQLV